MQSYGYAPGSVPYQRRVGFNSDGTLFTQGSGFFFGNQIPAVANFRGERDPVFYNDYAYTYNFGPDNALQLPLDRKNAFVRAEYELGDAAKIYVQGLYSDYSRERAARADAAVRHVPARHEPVHPGRSAAAARLAAQSSRQRELREAAVGTRAAAGASTSTTSIRSP